MAGLLDGYGVDPIAQGLLGAAQGLLTPRAYGGGVGAAMGGFNQGALQANALLRQQQQDALRAKLFDAQMRETDAQAKQREAMAKATEARAQQEAEQRARQQAFWQMLQGGPDAVAAQTGNLAPTNANAALLGKAPQITPAMVAAAAQAGVPIETLKSITESRNWGRDKVAREVTAAGADGSPETRLLTEYGDQVGGAMRQPVKREMLNTGNAFTPINPYTQSGALPINMSPAERDASARGWASNALARQRLEMDRTASAADKPDKWITDLQGGRQVNERTGEARPITQDGKPVGPRNDDAPKREQNARDALKIIEQAEGLLDKSTSGYIGTGVDKVAQAFGAAPAGAIAGGQLKTLQGALMMRMPRMEGPQSNLDVQLYRESVGQIGDTTVPVAVRKAALAEVRRLQEKYAGIEPTNTVDFKNVGRQSGGGTINFSDLK